MATDNVTPIRATDAQPPDGPRPKRARKARRHMLGLLYAGDGEGFTTLDVINGLRGVCVALDRAAVSDGCREDDLVGDLAMAARVLSEMVGNRVEES